MKREREKKREEKPPEDFLKMENNEVSTESLFPKSKIKRVTALCKRFRVGGGGGRRCANI